MSTITDSGGRYFGAVTFGQYSSLILSTYQDITGISCIGAAVVVDTSTAVTITGIAHIYNYLWLRGDKRIKAISIIVATGPTGPTGPGETGTTAWTGGYERTRAIEGKAFISNGAFLGVREHVIVCRAYITSQATDAPPVPDPGTSPITLANTDLVIYINGRSRISSPAPEGIGAKAIHGKACIKL